MIMMRGVSSVIIDDVSGKKYCYGSMEGEYCHCDYCKCKHGFGEKGYKGGCGHK